MLKVEERNFVAKSICGQFPLRKIASQTSSASYGFFCYVTSNQPIYCRSKAFNRFFCWFLGGTGRKARQGSNITTSLKNLAIKILLVLFRFSNFISGCLYQFSSLLEKFYQFLLYQVQKKYQFIYQFSPFFNFYQFNLIKT